MKVLLFWPIFSDMTASEHLTQIFMRCSESYFWLNEQSDYSIRVIFWKRFLAYLSNSMASVRYPF